MFAQTSVNGARPVRSRASVCTISCRRSARKANASRAGSPEPTIVVDLAFGRVPIETGVERDFEPASLQRPVGEGGGGVVAVGEGGG